MSKSIWCCWPSYRSFTTLLTLVRPILFKYIVNIFLSFLPLHNFVIYTTTTPALSHPVNDPVGTGGMCFRPLPALGPCPPHVVPVPSLHLSLYFRGRLPVIASPYLAQITLGPLPVRRRFRNRSRYPLHFPQ